LIYIIFNDKRISLKAILLVTPPFTQLNTPYPATAYLKGFLNTKNISSFQVDLGLEVLLALFSPQKMELFFQEAMQREVLSENCQRILSLKNQYLKTLPHVIAFLQGKQPTLARLITTSNFLPQAARFEQLDDLEYAFGYMGLQDKAKHLATLYLEDLSDFIVECIDPHFGFSRYAERLGRSANSFDALYEQLSSLPTEVDLIAINRIVAYIQEHAPLLVCFSVPFPGNLYSAFRCAQAIKQQFPSIQIAMGGGFPNTELRSLKDPRVFEFVDFIALDDGELPIELIYNCVKSNTHSSPILKRTFLLANGKVQFINNSNQSDYRMAEVGTPDYSDLYLTQYLSVIEIANPMHSLWSDGRWNKLTMAHGCYWGKCTFCDISLPYIQLYEPVAAAQIVDRMESMIQQTGESGFHFVDEAAPPALMKAIAIEIIRRNLVVTWWTNIRFEKNFTLDLCRLLHASGCVAVSGGLEVASDRLLSLIDKGVSVAQVAQVTKNLTESSIMVHAYLMYGYPTQTIQETVDSLEMVRQLFELGIIQSGFWHQFALTTHSPIGQDPEKYHIAPERKPISFADNDVQFYDSTGIDHNQFSFGLKKSLINYMHGIGLDHSLQSWFDFKIPETTIPDTHIASQLENAPLTGYKLTHRILFIGNLPTTSMLSKQKKGQVYEQLVLHFQTATETVHAVFEPMIGNWIAYWLPQLQASEKTISLQTWKADFEKLNADFDYFWISKGMNQLRKVGLVIV
jgi:hypothetical protein